MYSIIHAFMHDEEGEEYVRNMDYFFLLFVARECVLRVRTRRECCQAHSESKRHMKGPHLLQNSTDHGLLHY